jgi:hypothetical protein
MRRELAREEKGAPFDETYPLFLECGRQIGAAIVVEPSESLAAAVAADVSVSWPLP